MKNIILLFGGKSAEHDISIITAMQVRANLDSTKYNIFPIYINKFNKWFWAKKQTAPKDFIDFQYSTSPQVFLKAGENVLFMEGKFKSKPVCKVDCAIIACHGTNGEDGTLQGLLELSNIPHTSSGVASSAICMDKIFMKQIFEANNFPIPRYMWFSKQEYLSKPQKVIGDIKTALDFPVVVKPANLGSSIGITLCQNQSELGDAIDLAKTFDEKILVEEAVLHLRELNCAAFGMGEDITLSSIDEPATWQQFFGFKEKYIVKNAKAIKTKSQPLPAYIKQEIKRLTRAAYKTLGCAGVVRVDFLYNNDTEELFISEINSIPGSFSNFMFSKMSFRELLDKLVDLAERKFENKNACIFCFESSVLSQRLPLKK
ncbi:MAG: D-alanine--D-alanine ligase family protein [Clostridia bacterium]